ncbi:DUF1266 domain-containing protein [Chryseobacterium nakagawai]|uniref:DUF1266 domain-containing protein n=1 Tax=Chryseobacterium nakagawai TaxID=1241982 RepID=UPI001E571E88|nr:DUF1266 domain-containing protein [Chryseobacterium nakagawai]
MGYISEKELIEYLAKSHKELKKYCSTWKEYTTNYTLAGQFGMEAIIMGITRPTLRILFFGNSHIPY